MSRNVTWLLSHPTHFLSQTWRAVHRSNIKFAETCCLVTAIAYAEDKSDFVEWILQPDGMIPGDTDMWLISFDNDDHGDWMTAEHVLIVDNGTVTQSFYKKTGPTTAPYDQRFKNALQMKDGPTMVGEEFVFKKFFVYRANINDL